MWKRIGIGAVILIVVIAVLGGGDEENSTPVTSTTLTAGQQLINETTDCDKLQRGIDDRLGYLAEQEADPSYGMTETEVAQAEQSIELATERMEELNC